ncbi:MAG: molybdopterin oxidoreductase family protein [Actinomycetota bacterium]
MKISEKETVSLKKTSDDQIVFRTCPLCEAGCGLAVTVVDDEVTHIRGDMQDVFSKGFICPKGSTLKQLHYDTDRLRHPLIKRNGVHVQATWDEAWAAVDAGLNGVITKHGRESIGTYLGNPGAHGLSSMTFNNVFLKSLGSRQIYSASSVDQVPKQVASGYLFGSPSTVAVPDLDRTQYLLILGANPYDSNGSLCTAPDFPGRLETLQARSGKIVVVDPRKSKTAQHADEWIAIRPGTDALFLAAIANTLAADGLEVMDQRLGSFLNGVDEVAQALQPFTPEFVAETTGVDAQTIRRIASELRGASSSAVYARIGTTTTAFGTTASWLVDVVNIFTGNLDRVGGAMFPLPVAGSANTRGAGGSGKGFRTGRGHSRVSKHPEVLGEYPASAMAEEISTPGDGQIRAMVIIGGNPILSTPNGERLAKSFAELEFMVSVDIYLNETSRFADVILPVPSALQRSHYDLALLTFAVRNVANYSKPVLTRSADEPDEWEVLAKMSSIVSGLGVETSPSTIDDRVISKLVESATKDSSSSIFGRDCEEIISELSVAGRRGPDRILDFLLRTGPFGDGFGSVRDGLTLDMLIASPHGIDFGALEPRLPNILRTQSGKIELAVPQLIDDLKRLEVFCQEKIDATQLTLVGRRDLRSHNSWLHNIEVLVKGKDRCTLHIHPNDATRLGITQGSAVRITSRVGNVDAPVEITELIREGVVSLPHGWGHSMPGTKTKVASSRAGVNSNILTDEQRLDPLSGTSVLNGIPVSVAVV